MFCYSCQYVIGYFYATHCFFSPRWLSLISISYQNHPPIPPNPPQKNQDTLKEWEHESDLLQDSISPKRLELAPRLPVSVWWDIYLIHHCPWICQLCWIQLGQKMAFLILRCFLVKVPEKNSISNSIYFLLNTIYWHITTTRASFVTVATLLQWRMSVDANVRV